MKKTLTVVVLISLLFASCGNAAPEETTAGTDANTVTESAETESVRVNHSDVPETLDFGGAEYVVLSRSTCTSVNEEELTGEGVKDSVYERNRAAEEYLNIRIVENHSADTYLNELDISITAGEQLYAAAITHITRMTQFAMQGKLRNANHVEHLDLGKPYWAQGVTRSLSVANKPYLFSGDISITDNTNIWCVYFNKDLNAQLGKESPYEALAEGRWTLDYFSTALEDAALDVDGDGKWKWDVDRFALINPKETLCGFYNSCGQTAITLDAQGVMAFHLDSAESLEIMDRIATFASVGFGTTYLEYNQVKTGDQWVDLRGVFIAGRGLYYTHTVNITSELRDMEEEYGILPIPKADEAQAGYISSTQEWGQCVYGVPVCCPDTEMAGAALEYLCSLSTDTIRAAYYDVALARKYTRDNESVAVLDILFNNLVIDPAFGFNFGGCQGTVSAALAKGGTIASKVASVAKKVQGEMEKAQAAFSELE